MRIVFIGAVQFSEKALAKLIDMKASVTGVCTLEQSPFNSDHVDLTPMCNEHNIPVKYAIDINSPNSIEWIKLCSPDVIFCFGWSRLIKSELLNLAFMGVVGYHPARLPANRGRHPLIWSLVLGLDETASTFFIMDEGADSGDIISQRPIPIFENDNASSLYQRMIEAALDQMDEIVPALASNNCIRIPQDNIKANYWRKRGKKDGQIDWRMTASSIYNLVRGLTKPYLGAHFELEGQIIKVWEAVVIENNNKNIEPGKVLAVDESGILVKAGINSILLKRTEPVLEIIPGRYL
jgi:methionyl-tRNA formyltransferase